MRIDVGIGGYAVVNKNSESIKTYALGSCVAVVLHAPVRKAVGLIHIALPDSKGHDDKAAKLPGYFTDTGMEKLWAEMGKIGATGGSIVAKMIGGASVLADNGTFDIGRRNVLSVKKWLWAKGIGLMKEDTGGTSSRTVEAFTNGRVVVSTGKMAREL